MFGKKPDSLVVSAFVMMVLAGGAIAMNRNNPEVVHEPQQQIAAEPERIEPPKLDRTPAEVISIDLGEITHDHDHSIDIHDAEDAERESFRQAQQKVEDELLARDKEISNAISDADLKASADAQARSKALLQIQAKAMSDFQARIAADNAIKALEKIKAQQALAVQQFASTQKSYSAKINPSKVLNRDLNSNLSPEIIDKLKDGRMYFYCFDVYYNFDDPNDLVEVSVNGVVYAVTNAPSMYEIKIPVPANSPAPTITFRQVRDGDGKGMKFKAHPFPYGRHITKGVVNVEISPSQKITNINLGLPVAIN